MRKTGGYEEAAEILCTCSLANPWHVIFLTLGANHSEGALNRQAMDHGRVAHASRRHRVKRNWNSVECAEDDSEVVSAAGEGHPSSGVGEFKLKMEIVPSSASSSKYIRLVLFHNTGS
jgi:hypothetical protein